AALKAGAFAYVSKPVGLEQLRALVKSALSLPASAAAPAKGQRLLGENAPLAQVRELIGKLARTQAPVYISGESGSGKELAARLIHENGARRDKPFVPVNCGAIPDTLVESEFFGYKKGAFTGAAEDREGFFQAASGGTLFLDEVAERALALSTSQEIGSEDLRLTPPQAVAEERAESSSGEALPDYLDGLERKAILDALSKTGFNRTAAAKLLGITFRQLRYRMQRLGIRDENRP